ncbi:MAG: hypothetical protein JNK00_02355 [Flavipsychrobacter sp.]|nr:hypothetical protein [Flavipsychrobacter sp.]
MDNNNDKLYDQLAKAVLPHLINNLIEDGLLQESDLSSKSKVYSVILREIEKGIEWELISDHRKDILKHAGHYEKVKEIELYFMLVSTFFEHTLNYIIHHECKKRKLGDKIQKDIIKSANINSKLTWILALLGLPKLNEKHVEVIKLVSERRNAFVHYKWQPSYGTPSNQERQQKLSDESLLLSCKKAISYIKKYEARLVHKGRKNKVKQLMK